MFIDARAVPENKVIETEICIIGAGAAGITLSREFIGQPFRVCLLESGGLDFEADTQLLYSGDNVGLPYTLEGCRLRYFGGSTNHWSGFCRPLDSSDFETHSWISDSGWPFDKFHLDPFYVRAQPICRLGPFAYECKDWETGDRSPLAFQSNRVVSGIFQSSNDVSSSEDQSENHPAHFGKVYRDAIARAGNIDTYLHANVVDIEVNETANTVSRLRVACLGGNKFWVSAKLFILATGGIENARMLLLSNGRNQSCAPMSAIDVGG